MTFWTTCERDWQMALKKEIGKLKELKRSEPGCVDPDQYYIWEHSYYSTLMLERDFQPDQKMVSE